ncbi:MAG: PCMD domain-containing protein [Bacteroidales bacterium]|nr:PCMD domain-containing protein [Bacteroidales bacterium]
MKHFIFFIFFITITASWSQIPNASFETWQSFGSYENPTFWDTPNDLTSSFGKIVVSKESNLVYDGMHSIKITVVSSLFGNLPGIAVLGDFSFNMSTMSPSITGGIPFTQRPLKLKGYYQYEPNSPDNALIGIFLLKENGSSFDTISADGFEPTTTATQWTYFEIPINYRNSEAPTHMNILLMPTNRSIPRNGSTLYVDKLELDFPTSITFDENEIDFKIYFNNSSLLFEHDEKELLHVEIYDVLGHLVLQKLVDKKVETFDLPATKNIFIVKVNSSRASKTCKIVLP